MEVEKQQTEDLSKGPQLPSQVEPNALNFIIDTFPNSDINIITSSSLKKEFSETDDGEFGTYQKGVSSLQRERVNEATIGTQIDVDNRLEQLKKLKLEYKYKLENNLQGGSNSKINKDIKGVINRYPANGLRISLNHSKKSPQAEIIMTTVQLQQRIQEIAQSIRKRVKRRQSNHRQKAGEGGSKTQNIKLKSKIQNTSAFYQKQFGFLTDLKPQSQISGLRNHSLISQIDPRNEISVQKGERREKISYIDKIQQKQKKDLYKMMKQLLNKQVLKKFYKTIQQKEKQVKIKLNFDLIKHKYPMNYYRKMILNGKKQREKEQFQRLKIKQNILLKRRILYNNSRLRHQSKQILPFNIQNLSEGFDKQSQLIQSGQFKGNKGISQFLLEINNPEIDIDQEFNLNQIKQTPEPQNQEQIKNQGHIGGEETLQPYV